MNTHLLLLQLLTNISYSQSILRLLLLSSSIYIHIFVFSIQPYPSSSSSLEFAGVEFWMFSSCLAGALVGMLVGLVMGWASTVVVVVSLVGGALVDVELGITGGSPPWMGSLIVTWMSIRLVMDPSLPTTDTDRVSPTFKRKSHFKWSVCVNNFQNVVTRDRIRNLFFEKLLFQFFHRFWWKFFLRYFWRKTDI